MEKYEKVEEFLEMYKGDILHWVPIYKNRLKDSSKPIATEKAKKNILYFIETVRIIKDSYFNVHQHGLIDDETYFTICEMFADWNVFIANYLLSNDLFYLFLD